jgi:hypothetical protein
MTGHAHSGGAPAPSREQAAAIVAAIERFVRETAPAPREPDADRWRAAAILEGTARDPWAAPSDSPWINT